MSLYHDIRPQTLDTLCGNISTKAGIRSWLDKGVGRSHSLLFYGPTGCGKTTLARIIAKELNCHDFDYQEINASNNRGIEVIRDIDKNMKLSPSMASDCKIYVIDECHELPQLTQNAFLKPLEDTPKHVYFILCTTHPQKLLDAVRGRCSSFEVKPLAAPEMNRYLKITCASLKKSISDRTLAIIAEKSGGRVREALVALEKVIDLPEADQEAHLVRIDREETQTMDLCRILFNRGDWSECANILCKLSAAPETARFSVCGYARAILSKAAERNKIIQASQLLEVFTSKKFIDKDDLWAMCAKHILSNNIRQQPSSMR